MIPTAEEVLKKSNATGMAFNREAIQETMIEFAELHVRAALLEALDSIPCLGSSTDIPTYEEVECAVLAAYPKELIK